MSDYSVNERGNRVYDTFHFGRSRATYDFVLCRVDDGWESHGDDGPYYACWVHPEHMEIVTFSEGDARWIHCVSPQSFAAELAFLEEGIR